MRGHSFKVLRLGDGENGESAQLRLAVPDLQSRTFTFGGRPLHEWSWSNGDDDHGAHVLKLKELLEDGDLHGEHLKRLHELLEVHPKLQILRSPGHEPARIEVRAEDEPEAPTGKAHELV